MESIETSTVVSAPIADVYEHWTRLEEFPRFMEDVREVRKVEEKRYLTISEVDGQQYESLVEVMLEIPERRIAWRSVSGPESSGMVFFEPDSSGGTRVGFKMRYAADEGLHQPVALEERLRSHLRNFKRLIEAPAS